MPWTGWARRTVLGKDGDLNLVAEVDVDRGGVKALAPAGLRPQTHGGQHLNRVALGVEIGVEEVLGGILDGEHGDVHSAARQCPDLGFQPGDGLVLAVTVALEVGGLQQPVVVTLGTGDLGSMLVDLGLEASQPR